MAEYFRGNLFANTPDILPPILQQGGRAGLQDARSSLAATLSSLYGIYSGYELCENAAVPGSEEYLDSEKYEIKVRDWDAPGNIRRVRDAPQPDPPRESGAPRVPEPRLLRERRRARPLLREAERGRGERRRRGREPRPLRGARGATPPSPRRRSGSAATSPSRPTRWSRTRATSGGGRRSACVWTRRWSPRPSSVSSASASAPTARRATEPRRARQARPAEDAPPWMISGTRTPSSTRCTSRRSRTRTTTASAISRASPSASTTSRTWASTASGCCPSIRPRSGTTATTSPTTGTSRPSTARWRTSTSSSARRTAAAFA